MAKNLWWASGYNDHAISPAAGVLARTGIILSPAIGAALMSLRTVIIALQLRRSRL